MSEYRYEYIKTDRKEPIFIHLHDKNAEPFVLDEHWCFCQSKSVPPC